MSIDLLRFERDETPAFEGFGVLWLEQPGKPVVVLDHSLMRRIEATVRGLPRDLRGLVLASASERSFVAGADLKAIQDLSDEQLHAYLAYGSEVFAMFAKLPYPTAAAIAGAALGGGLELAMHCDGLIGAPSPSGKPYPVGLPEAGLSICPGWGGTNLLPARMDPADAITRTATGATMTFDEARAAGLFDAVADSHAELLPAAKNWLKSMDRRFERDGAPSRWIGRPGIGSKVLAALDAVKAQVGAQDPGASVIRAIDAGLARGWPAALEVEQRELVRLRSTPAGKQAIQAFFDRSKR